MKHQSVPHKILILDRAADLYAYVTFGGEAVDNSICIDDKGGIYVVTPNACCAGVDWQTIDEADGAGVAYEAMDPSNGGRALPWLGHYADIDGATTPTSWY
jgi:hypothetical protein